MGGRHPAGGDRALWPARGTPRFRVASWARGLQSATTMANPLLVAALAIVVAAGCDQGDSGPHGDAGPDAPAGGGPDAPPPGGADAAMVTHFATVPPGATLPSGATCAALVRARPENKRVNATANATRGGQGIGTEIFAGDEAAANQWIRPRVDGDFTGTTDEILQWAACKWGIDEDLVRAQAAKESWWQQTAKGDWTTDASVCPPGHGLGADGRAGECPESYGVLQNRYQYEKSGFPAAETSTAFNADLAYAIWRACFEGYETWLNTVERGRDYAAGDALGCMGRWFSGRWHTAAAETYIDAVEDYRSQRIWETPSFQEP